jgi:hypothetical protein
VARLVARAARARAGRRFPAQIVARPARRVRQLEVLCEASVAGRPLVAVRVSHVRRGGALRGRCVWAVPRWAAGKRLYGSVGIVYRGGRAEVRFAARVRPAPAPP